jgi:hypothetical protein
MHATNILIAQRKDEPLCDERGVAPRLIVPTLEHIS